MHSLLLAKQNAPMWHALLCEPIGTFHGEAKPHYPGQDASPTHLLRPGSDKHICLESKPSLLRLLREIGAPVHVVGQVKAHCQKWYRMREF